MMLKQKRSVSYSFSMRPPVALLRRLQTHPTMSKFTTDLSVASTPQTQLKYLVATVHIMNSSAIDTNTTQQTAQLNRTGTIAQR